MSKKINIEVKSIMNGVNIDVIRKGKGDMFKEEFDLDRTALELFLKVNGAVNDIKKRTVEAFKKSGKDKKVLGKFYRAEFIEADWEMMGATIDGLVAERMRSKLVVLDKLKKSEVEEFKEELRKELKAVENFLDGYSEIKEQLKEKIANNEVKD